ncbi:Alanine-tRNA ligase [Venturia nashicola]|uniref:Alanine--tRNA ligase n=1 Tax=Venturia nashicola TaxID=86259 RepID=A0A4Z1NQF0_9PEZI|nr:Alanine--tRNA ligase [Venturia nashicola]TLD24600.1 Alanine-tRNA ligase [Venturia nashicola]
MSNPADIQKAYNTTVPKLKDALAADKDKYDCFSCRVIGATTFVGLGGFTYYTGHAQLRQSEAMILKSGSKLGMAQRRAGITAMSIGMAAIGLYRLVN